MDRVDNTVLVCLRCERENPIHTKCCLKCGARLGTETVAPRTKELLTTNIPILEPEQRNISLKCPVGTTMLLQIEGQVEPRLVELPVNRTILLGRSTCRNSGFVYDEKIDLNDYGGGDAGVSRQHALLARMVDGLRIVDLDSRNGTYIHDQKLRPFHAYELAGDEAIRLGYLTIHLYVESRISAS